MVRAAYGNGEAAFSSTDKSFQVARIILALRDAYHVNDAALRLFLLGLDTRSNPANNAACLGSSDLFPVQCLNTPDSNGLPRRKLDLKKGCSAMLLARACVRCAVPP